MLKRWTNAAVFLISERASWITGACLGVDGGQRKANIQATRTARASGPVIEKIKPLRLKP